MELIILNDGLYQLIPVSKQMMEHVSLLEPVNCMETLCKVRDTGTRDQKDHSPWHKKL